MTAVERLRRFTGLGGPEAPADGSGRGGYGALRFDEIERIEYVYLAFLVGKGFVLLVESIRFYSSLCSTVMRFAQDCCWRLEQAKEVKHAKQAPGALAPVFRPRPLVYR